MHPQRQIYAARALALAAIEQLRDQAGKPKSSCHRIVVKRTYYRRAVVCCLPDSREYLIVDDERGHVRYATRMQRSHNLAEFEPAKTIERF
jgi:hypothetical protein